MESLKPADKRFASRNMNGEQGSQQRSSGFYETANY